MRVLYLVTAYHELEQLGRLCATLQAEDGDALVIIQFDAGSPHASAANGLPFEVVWTDGPIGWGDGSYANAIVQSMRRLLEREWDWLVLLSGQDHVAKPLTGLHAELQQGGFRAYSAVNASLDQPGPRHEILTQRYLYQYRWPSRSWPRWLRSAAVRLGRALTLITRGHVRLQPRPRGSAPGLGIRSKQTIFSQERGCWMGSDYFAARRDMVADVVALLDREPHVLEYFLHTFIPSEGLFPSLFRWIDHGQVADRYFHFMRFSGEANPRRLTPDDLDEMGSSGAYFARKFNDEDTWVTTALPVNRPERDVQRR